MPASLPPASSSCMLLLLLGALGAAETAPPSLSRELLRVAHVRPGPGLHIGENLLDVVPVVVHPLLEEIFHAKPPHLGMLAAALEVGGREAPPLRLDQMADDLVDGPLALGGVPDVHRLRERLHLRANGGDGALEERGDLLGLVGAGRAHGTRRPWPVEASRCRPERIRARPGSPPCARRCPAPPSGPSWASATA